MPDNELDNLPKNNRINLSLDLRIISVLLLLVIITMLLIWKPWAQTNAADARTVTVSGEAIVKAVPDEFVFQPTYEFKEANKEAALTKVAAKSDEILKELKKLGISENKIKTSSDGYNYNYYPEQTNDSQTYSLRLTVTVNDQKIVQKVQDYLVSTAPSGQVSPQPTFSKSKRKELQNKARDEATKDARARADQLAENIGFKVGKVKSIDDGNQFGGIEPMPMARDMALSTEESKTTSLNVQPGENELNYTIKIVYYVR